MFTNQNKDYLYLKLAFHQAEINLGSTSLNPSVGCVIVKNNSVISSGRTSFNGGPHAEANTVEKKRNLNGSNIYITLEPCSHYGKTSPCVKKIINSKIKKIYFSIKDPDLRSFNKSLIKFKKSNVAVNIGVYSNKIKKFYKSYIQSKNNKLPFVTCKIAISKDFFTINKKKKWITNSYSRGRVHLMRSLHDAIITSVKTIKTDNPSLNCRIEGLESRSPSRIILDNHLKISINSTVIKDGFKYKTIIFYHSENEKKIRLLKKLGIKIYKIPLNINGDLDLEKVLIKANKLGFFRIFLEAGKTIISNFLRENLVNDLNIFISNNKLGKNGAGNIKKYLLTLFKKKKYIFKKVNFFCEKLIL